MNRIAPEGDIDVPLVSKMISAASTPEISSLTQLELTAKQINELRELSAEFKSRLGTTQGADRLKLAKVFASKLKEILLEEQLAALAKIIHMNNVFQFVVSPLGVDFLQMKQTQVDRFKLDCSNANREIEKAMKEIEAIKQRCRENVRSTFSTLSGEQLSKVERLLGQESSKLFENENLESLFQKTKFKK
ncbi:MAG: hypothetical protein AAFN77_18360 [Planctomycetota bacterium]